MYYESPGVLNNLEIIYYIPSSMNYSENHEVSEFSDSHFFKKNAKTHS